ncbi:hypothetical protein EYF80_044782 [Liparis tanakae]|uniref:Uncharacterized protein n=1 Tax=Liparis tanakae TaxID=230148 RepID=A0A4Z2FVS4_9TELE|nr:hypothetical protein EYF80_044782 [Liparis tanakae]
MLRCHAVKRLPDVLATFASRERAAKKSEIEEPSMSVVIHRAGAYRRSSKPWTETTWRHRRHRRHRRHTSDRADTGDTSSKQRRHRRHVLQAERTQETQPLLVCACCCGTYRVLLHRGVPGAVAGAIPRVGAARRGAGGQQGEGEQRQVHLQAARGGRRVGLTARRRFCLTTIVHRNRFIRSGDSIVLFIVR